jgi:two-component system KDP operon response regulator KdpE
VTKRERPVVLVAAPDTAVGRLVATALRSEGFLTDEADAFSEPVAALAERHPDAVVLQSGFGETGPGRELRAQAEVESIPVLWLGRRPGPMDAVEALDDNRADDYVAPPFDPMELGARLRALVRRHGTALAAGRRRVGDALVDLDRREVRLDGVPRPLARSDWAVLTRLLEADGLPVSHAELLSCAFGSSFRDERSRLRAAVQRLRRALGARPGESGPIRAVRGIGYRLEA